MDILFDKAGYPVMMTSNLMFAEAVGKRSARAENKLKKLLQPFDFVNQKYVSYNGYKVACWGKENKFPQRAAATIAGTSVLNTGLKFLRSLTIGQGIYPCTVSGFDDKGNEQLTPIDDKAVLEFVNSRMVRRFLEKASRDYFKFGSAYTQLLPNDKGEIVSMQAINALYTRLTLPDAYGNCKAIVTGDWPLNAPTRSNTYEVFDVMSDTDVEGEFERRDIKGINKSLVFAIRDSWSNDELYAEPVWLPAYYLGWVEIAHLVPKFLQKAYENQTTWKWHVQIPYSYWDKKYPAEDYEPKERERKIRNFMDSVERNLCGVENAEKPLFTHYAVNEGNGRIEEEWKITALDNKYKGGENLVTSAAANSEILFALMVNPNVFGAGMPGGTYAGNQGGSNIREAFLVNIANAWIDRQCLLDPIKLVMRQRFADKNIELRFRNTVLTTLDSGAGTTKTLS